MVGLCGTDLNTFRGRNAMMEFPRVLGHEIAATVLEAGVTGGPMAGTDVTVLPYTTCGKCSSCRRGRVNACRSNATFGVQRDGGLTERLAVPVDNLYTAPPLSLREL